MKTQKKNAKKQLVYDNPAAKMKIPFKFDRPILNMFIGYIFSDDQLITKMNLNNLYKLLEMTDTKTLETDLDLYNRFVFAKSALEGKLQKGINKSDLLVSYCRQLNNPICDEIIKRLEEYKKISSSEITYITNSITDRLHFSFIVIFKEIITDEFMRIDIGDYTSYKEIVDSLKEKCGAMMNEIRKASSASSHLTFSLQEDIFDNVVEDVVKEVIDPSTVLMTGLQTLNLILSPGYMPGRLYMYLGRYNAPCRRNFACKGL